jgi:hypothetical protein
MTLEVDHLSSNNDNGDARLLERASRIKHARCQDPEAFWPLSGSRHEWRLTSIVRYFRVPALKPRKTHVAT